MLAITKASLRAISRSPSTVIFSIFFPLVFILVFGLLGNGGTTSYKVVLDKNSDTSNAFIDSLKSLKNVKLVDMKDSLEIESDLIKGRITGILNVQKASFPDTSSEYTIHFQSTTASADKYSTFLPLLENIVNKIDKVKFKDQPTFARLVPQIESVRPYRTIDFILPGQLGFSLLSSGVFGVAFLFFNLRQQLVLKRLYATPIKRGYILLGEGISRVIFQLITTVIILAIGYYAFSFTLVKGWFTVLEILLLSFISLLVFMGFGFIISGIAKTESLIPPLANVITMPQFLLAGTFFPIDVFPKWLQPISWSMPLTHFNDAMRLIAFEGAHLTDCWPQLLALLGWGILVYGVAIKTFKWE